MRKIGGHVSVAGGLLKAIDNTLSIEGNCMQIFAGSPRSWIRQSYDDLSITAFRFEVDKNHLDPVFIHALYLVNLATDNAELLNKSKSSLISDLNIGEKIKSSGVILHIGSHQGRGFDSVSAQLVQVITDILSQTTNTPLLLENAAGQNGKIGSLAEIGFLIKQVHNPRLGICLDTAHIFASGCNVSLSSGIEELVVELTQHNLLDKLACIHLNDSASELDSHRDLHANLGEGKIGLQGLTDLVNHPSLAHLPLILEVPGDGKGPDQKNINQAQNLCKV